MIHQFSKSERQRLDLVGSLQDRIIELEDQVRYQALHDPLTGLPNRAFVVERATHLLDDARGVGSQVTALWIDLNDFGAVNDVIGISAADELLQAIARRLCGVMRDSDAIARVRSDEFVILFVHPSDICRGEVAEKRLSDSFLLPIRCGNRSWRVGTNVGIATGYGRAEELLEAANASMHDAKLLGNNSYAIPDSSTPTFRA
jgi:diguanylate cyclase (GGDEF)-like protein